MVAVDTNLLIRYFIRDNEQYYQHASSFVNGLKPHEGYVDAVVLAEIGYVLRSYYKRSKHEVAIIYGGLVTSSSFSFGDRHVIEQAIGNYATEAPLSFEDCWLLALQQTGKVDSVQTFDKNLQKRLAKA